MESRRYTEIKWPHPDILVWVLMPFGFITELLLGIRQPKVMLVDNTSTKPLYLRTYIPCDACGENTPAVLYTAAPFGNYAGRVCASCGASIACVSNIFSLPFIWVTWPLWKPLKPLVAPRLRARQLRKLQAAKSAGHGTRRRPVAISLGLVAGISTWVFFMSAALAPCQSVGDVLGKATLYAIVLGVLFGLLMHIFYDRPGRTAQKTHDAKEDKP